MTESLTRLININFKEGALATLLTALSCTSLQAIDGADRGAVSTTKKLSALSLNTTDPTASKGKQDAFSWQNTKHYEAVVKIFEDLADRELTSTIQNLIVQINSERQFFDRTYQYVISHEQERIFGWMNEHVLTDDHYQEELSRQEELSPWQQQSNYYDESSYESDDGESFARAFMRGYEQGGDSDDDTERSSNSSGDDERNDYDEYGYDDPLSFQSDEDTEDQDQAFEDWKIAKLNDMLSIRVQSMADFTQESIHIKAIKRALKEHTHGGGNLEYSWLLNETIEGSLSASEDFSSLVHKKMGVPQDLVANIFGGLWFDYNWEEFEIDEPRFLQKTYIKTLTDLLEGKRATDVRESLLERIRNLFTFNQDDFNSPLKDIHAKYEAFNKRKDWLGALVEWSVYSTYRKVFADPSKKSQIQKYQSSERPLPLFQSFNREDYLLTRLNDAYRRAQADYTKVYPHPDTKKIVFGPTRLNRAELDLRKAFGEIRGVGRFLEPSRKKGTENVFVPQLYFIVSSKPNQASPSDGQQFFQVPLCFEGLPRRPLTRATADKIFGGVSDTTYFNRVRTDVVTGRVLQGKGKEEAEAEINVLINGNALPRNQKLVHSERGVVHALSQRTNVTKICTDFANLLKTSCGKGLYTVHGAAMLGYSTNTVCPCCTPTLISLQNSHETGGFLNLLVQELNNLRGDVVFNNTGYDVGSNKMDWTQFRLNTFVTAKINFDSEAHDLAEEGQHSHGQVKKAPPTHNPHAKLFFPNDEIDISEPVVLENGTPDPYQRFFYEFVGKDMHDLPTKDNPYIHKNALKFPGVVFSSGSTPWGHGKMQG